MKKKNPQNLVVTGFISPTMFQKCNAKSWAPSTTSSLTTDNCNGKSVLFITGWVLLYTVKLTYMQKNMTCPFLKILWFSKVDQSEVLQHSLLGIFFHTHHLFWPIRWQRAAACKSFWGLKSLSIKMTVSAAVRFMPTPPAKTVLGNLIILSENTKHLLFTHFYLWYTLGGMMHLYSSQKHIETVISCDRE